MPKLLKEFLLNLDPIDASGFWNWLDENPTAVDDMIDIVANVVKRSHPRD